MGHFERLQECPNVKHYEAIDAIGRDLDESRAENQMLGVALDSVLSALLKGDAKEAQILAESAIAKWAVGGGR